MQGLYIHIPYCKQACHYCNFHFSTTLQSMNEMVEAICSEIKLRKSFFENPTIDTIYFGGGTPAILPLQALEKIIVTVQNNFDCSKTIEFTLEANPDDMTKEYLEGLKNLGVNRLSIGVQSFFEEDLIYMNRSHDAAAAKHCLELAHQTGFDNLSLDLIYGFPLLSDKKWLSNLNTTIEFGITHLSCYAMTVEPKTALAKKIQQKSLPDISDAQGSKQFDMLMNWLEKNNWQHYEISNCSKPGHHAIHNTNYWNGDAYLGIGPSAHSFDGKQERSWNIANNAQYISALQKENLPSEKEILNAKDIANEYIMTALRMKDGINMQQLKGKMPLADYTEFESVLAMHPTYFTITNHSVSLTNTGKHYADTLASMLFF
jgi:oxygen-independent coproporphyrinogen III oxidase